LLFQLKDPNLYARKVGRQLRQRRFATQSGHQYLPRAIKPFNPIGFSSKYFSGILDIVFNQVNIDSKLSTLQIMQVGHV